VSCILCVVSGINFNYKELYPLIHVYTGLLPDVDNLMSTARMSHESGNGQYYLSEWKDWFLFGKYAWANPSSIGCDNTLDPRFRAELDFCNTVEKANMAAMSHYVAMNNVPLPENVHLPTINYGMYYPNIVVASHQQINLTMHYHTDFNIGEWFWPGDKFIITATTYFNDDYEGGEIHFCVDNEIIRYRPHAGEIIVFPSGSPLYPGDKPYFHGVTEITSGNRLIARNYLKYTVDGTSQWYEGLEKYGKDEWLRIASEGAKGHNQLHLDVFPNKVETAYGGVRIWESPLVKQVYKK
jgi:hypothetical protein